VPDLDFSILKASVVEYALEPMLGFTVRVEDAEGNHPIQSVMLHTQIRLDVKKRAYDPATETRLIELFGSIDRWGQTLRNLLWTTSDIVVPGFDGATEVELPVTCTYDFEVAATKYLWALQDGSAPLQFLFSGTVFYVADSAGVQIAPIPWEKEASFSLPAELWHEMMDRYFPNSSWLRINRDLFARLCEFKAREGLATWDAVIENLLAAARAGALP
jgi:hypothetical protein